MVVNDAASLDRNLDEINQDEPRLLPPANLCTRLNELWFLHGQSLSLDFRSHSYTANWPLHTLLSGTLNCIFEALFFFSKWLLANIRRQARTSDPPNLFFKFCFSASSDFCGSMIDRLSFSRCSWPKKCKLPRRHPGAFRVNGAVLKSHLSCFLLSTADKLAMVNVEIETPLGAFRKDRRISTPSHFLKASSTCSSAIYQRCIKPSMGQIAAIKSFGILE